MPDKIAPKVILTVALLAVSVSMPAAAVVLRTSVDSVGEVTLSCPTPGNWTFALEKQNLSDGVDVVTVRMKAPKAEPPPVFDLSWLVSQRDAHHFWSSASTHYGIPWSAVHVSDISSELPLYAYLDANDHNRYTFSCSESCRRVEFRSPIIETKMAFAGSFRFFTSPEAPLSDYDVSIRFDTRDVFYSEALAEASDWMCVSCDLDPLPAPESAFDPLYSSWYTFHQRVSADLVEEECALAAPLGMKTVILDDGWQIDQPLDDRKFGGYYLCGDWKAGRNFPDMAAHVRRIHQLGYKYMVWFSVPFVGEKSANWERFKDKLLPDSCAGGWVMDPRFPEVRDFLISTYEQALAEWDIDGFKFDFIGRFTLKPGVADPAVAQGYAGRDIKSIPAAVDVLLTDVMTRLRTKKPGILIEFRQPYIGPCIRKFGNMIRASDYPLLEGESAAERVWGVYQPNLVVPTGSLDRPVYIVNGANTTDLPVDFAVPAIVEKFDTFGNPAGTEQVSAGLRRVSVPISGYLKVN